MPAKKKTEKPLTLPQLVQFYNKTIEPRLNKIEKGADKTKAAFERRIENLHQKLDESTGRWEKLKWDVKTKEEYFIGAMKKELQETRQELSTHGMRFYNENIDSRLKSLEKKLDRLHNEGATHFDELYKKFDDFINFEKILSRQVKGL